QEEGTLRKEAKSGAERRSGVEERAAKADAVVAAAEKTFGELTVKLADLTARRNQLNETAREQADRMARIEAEIANIEAGLAAAGESRARVPAARSLGRDRESRHRQSRAGRCCGGGRPWQCPEAPRRNAIAA